MKKLLCAALCLMMLLSLCSCLSPVSLDAYGYVITIGADRGKTKRYYFTLQLQRELSEPGTDLEGGAILLCAEGDSLDEAITEIEGNVPYSLNFSRTNFFIFSEETARAGDIEDVLSLSFDSMKIRASAAIVVAEDSAFGFIGGLSSNNEANVRKLQEAVYLDMEKTGMVTLLSVSRLFEAVRDESFDYCAALGRFDDGIVTDMEQKKAENEGKDPLENAEIGVRVGGLKSYMTGAALFSGYRMTGKLDRSETELLNAACGDLKTGMLTLPFERDGESVGLVTLILTEKSLKRCVEITDNGMLARVGIELYAGIHKKPESMTGEETDSFLKGAAKAYLEKGLKEVFEKCRASDCDAMRFGTDAVRLFRSDAEWESFDWKAKYPSLEAEFSVTLINTDKSPTGDMQ